MTRTIVHIGEVVEGRYKIVRGIAEGGMGTVFLAEHWLIKRKVALKFLHAELVTDAQMVRRFMNEALAAGTLGHPNIVESTDMGFHQDIPYIVFEYLEGSLLSDEVRRAGRLPVPRALWIAHQIASALDAAHAASIVHRDLKSDNIFLTERRAADHVKVLDFGISRFLAAADRTGAGATVLGTPEFMAPEQISSPDRVDKRADVYALGVLLYEMLGGAVPFRLEVDRHASELDAAHAVLRRILDEPPPPLERPDAPVGLVQMILEKLLAKQPARRFQSMKDAQAALEAFAGVLPGGSFVLPATPRAVTPVAIDQITDRTVSAERLEPAAIAREVAALGKRWSLAGADLQLDLYSDELARLARVVSCIAEIADEHAHQPRLSIADRHLRVTIGNAVTVVELVFAARVEQWLRANGW